MQNQITPQQALTSLYQATRKAPLTADEHNFILECAKVLEDIINPKPTPKKEEKKTE